MKKVVVDEIKKASLMDLVAYQKLITDKIREEALQHIQNYNDDFR